MVQSHAWLCRDCYGLSRRQRLLWPPFLHSGPGSIALLIISGLLIRFDDQPGKRVRGRVAAHCRRMLQI